MNNPTPLVVANLKANKTWNQIVSWLDQVGKSAASFAGTIVVCPSSPFLAASAQKIGSEKLALKLGSQDISRFEQGAYTGEVAASQIADLCRYIIIGHSERRHNFAESETVLAQKVKNAQNAKIEPIFCVQSDQDPIPEGVEIVTYEPTFAIGTGNPDSPENAHNVARKIKERGSYKVLYGGSVAKDNVNSFLAKSVLDGVLVGATNSLDPQKFIQVLAQATY